MEEKKETDQEMNSKKKQRGKNFQKVMYLKEVHHLSLKLVIGEPLNLFIYLKNVYIVFSVGSLALMERLLLIKRQANL